MKQYRFPIVFGTILAKLFTAFCVWHSPRRRKLTREEIDHYMAIIEKLPARAEGIQAFTSRIRPWAEADDGKPVFMLNLIRFYPQLRTFAGAPEFKGTPEEANAYYEKSITSLWLTHAAYPIFAGASQAKNLINIHPEKDWGRVVVCRYPSRRTFFETVVRPCVRAHGTLQVHSPGNRLGASFWRDGHPRSAGHRRSFTLGSLSGS
jgi:hypothetical protein